MNKNRHFAKLTKKVVPLALAGALIFTGIPTGAAQVYAASTTSVETLVAQGTTVFTFSDSGISVSGNEDGYKIDGTTLKIKASGTYIVQGSCSEGSIQINKEVSDVTLVLNGLTLTSSTTAPIAVNKSNTNVVIDIEGTNTITDNEDPANEDSTDEAVADAFEGAAIKVKSGSSVTFTGSGTLNANGNAKNGIKGGATATITVGASASDIFTINVDAANTGLASDGSVVINGGTVNIDAENDGIKASPDEDDTDSAATILITGGTVDVKAGDNGIKADQTTTITGGNVTVDAGDDGIKAEYTVNIGTEGASTGPVINVENAYEGIEAAVVNLYSGSGNVITSDDGINAANGDLSNYSFSLNIYGGSWMVNAGGDGLDSNGDLNVSGGYTEVFGAENNGNAAIDYGDFGSSFNVTGGTIAGIGMSGMAVTPTSGTYVVFGGAGMGGGMGGMSGEMPGDMSGDQSGRSGKMPGDMSGNMPDGMAMGQNGGQGGMMRGGFTRTASYEDSEETFVSESSYEAGPGMFGGMGDMQGQSSISISAGSTIEVKDSAGNTVYSTTAKKSANSIVLSTDNMTEGETYTLYVDGTETATATAASGSTNNGGMNGGSQGEQPGGQQNGQPDGSGEMPGAPENGQQGVPGQEPSSENGAAAGETVGQDTAVTEPTSGEEQQDASEQGTPMYRMYNPNTGEHFYTVDTNERDSLDQIGWNYEGIAWYGTEEGAPVFRLYNPNTGDHHYTMNEAETTTLVEAGWEYEGIGWHSAAGQGTPVYRLYNPNRPSGAHHYTTDINEVNMLRNIGWQYEDIGWYGI